MTLDLRPAAAPLKRDAGGIIRVGGTRVTLESVLRAYRQGETPDGIRECFPSLDLGTIHATLAWYHRNRRQAAAYLRLCDAEGARNRAEAERRTSTRALLARIRARRRR